MTTIIEDVKLDFRDVLLMPKRSTISSRSELGDLSRSFKFKHSTVTYTGTPIVVANMDTTGTFAMARSLKKYNMAVALHKFYTAEALIKYFSSPDMNDSTFYSMGITDSDFEKFKTVYEATKPTGFLSNQDQMRPIKYLCIDVANGYSRKFVAFVEKMRDCYNDLVIMAGNVVTGDMVYDLLERGADIVKVGIGPGSVCTTRRITGVGYPQLSAILECQDAAHGADGLICGDGGIVEAGDFSKAFAAGSDFVMAGGIFAGHEECEGEIIGLDRSLKQLMWPAIEQNHTMMCVKVMDSGKDYVVEVGKWFKFIDSFNANKNMIIPDDFKWAVNTEIPSGAKMRFYGMSSQEAMEKHYGGKADYRAAEGKVVEVPFKGPVSKTVEEILGGIRSAGSMIGARRLKDMSKCATFVRVNRTLNESLSQYNV